MSSRDHARRFHFLREIASGGFGSVYLAKVMHADGFSRLVAVKLLHQRWSENREIAERMRDEARLLGWLRHRNIVDVIDLTTIGGRVAVVMEYLDAVDLKSVGTALLARREKMSVRAALEVLGFVASALDAAYNRPPYQGEKPLRVIHRDLKPSNLMVDDSGTVKVLDFGVARADFDHRESHTQELQFGSIEYMPPERLFKEPESPASDLYSLGATLYEVIALEKLGKARGRTERHAAHVQERIGALRLSGRLPEAQAGAIIELLGAMLAHDPTRRPSAGEVVIQARALARRTDGEGLMEWAERVVPPLVKQNRDAPRETNPLVDTVLSEDSALLRWTEGTDPGWTDPQVAALIAAQAEPVPFGVAEPSLVRMPVLGEGGAPPPAPGRTAPAAVVPASRPVPVPPTILPSVPIAAVPVVAAPVVAAPIVAVPVVAVPVVAVPVAAAPVPGAPPVEDDAPEAAATAQFTASALASQPRPSRITPAAGVRAPIAEDPRLLSVPFPRHLLTAEEDQEAESDLRDPEDNSDVHVVVTRASPTLVFPLHVPPDRNVEGDDVGELDATAPAIGREALLDVARRLTAEPAPGGASGGTSASPTFIPVAATTTPDPMEAERDAPRTRTNPPVVVQRIVRAPPDPSSSDVRPRGLDTEIRPRLAAPTLVEEDEDLPPRRSSAGRWLMAGLVVLFIGLCGVSLVAWGAWRWVIRPALTARATPTVAPPAEAAPVTDPDPTAPVPPDVIRFASLAPGTSRITITCDGQEVSGRTAVDWTGAAAACTVRVMLQDRSRLYAEVLQPVPGVYRCFGTPDHLCVE